MKKVIFCFALMFIAGAIQAASITWKTDTKTIITPGGTTNLENAIAYLYQANATTATNIKNEIVTQKNGWTPTGYIDSNTSNKGGMLSSTSASGSWDIGTSYSYFVVVFDKSTVAESSYFMISSVLTGVSSANPAQTPDDILAWNATTIGTLTNCWVAVPEPTTLALLALGVAGLALRRKRV